MMFCIIEDYTIPLHTLITDVIDGQGGSAMLIKILNRLGVCASADTLSRYIQHKCTNRTDAIHQYLSSDSFTVVSANSSTHATSIQAVQPMSSLSELVDDVSICIGESPDLTIGTPG